MMKNCAGASPLLLTQDDEGEDAIADRFPEDVFQIESCEELHGRS